MPKKKGGKKKSTEKGEVDQAKGPFIMPAPSAKESSLRQE